MAMADQQRRRRRRVRQDTVLDLTSVWGPADNDQLVLWAASHDRVDALRQALADGANLYARDPQSDDTALHLAMKHGHKSVILFLLDECHFDMNVRNNRNCSPAMTAAHYEHFDVLRMLLGRMRRRRDQINQSGSAVASPQYPRL